MVDSTKRVVLILSVFLFSLMVPFSETFSTTVSAEPVQVCCDSASLVDLYLIGGTSGELTPYQQKPD